MPENVLYIGISCAIITKNGNYKKVHLLIVSERGNIIMPHPILIAVVVALLVIGYLLTLPKKNRLRRMKNAGYEYCGQTSSLGDMDLWVKDSELYIGGTTENVIPVEIIKLSEITRNAKLHELEIRYRYNGEVKSARIRGSQDQLLTYMDQLGYS